MTSTTNRPVVIVDNSREDKAFISSLKKAHKSLEVEIVATVADYHALEQGDNFFVVTHASALLELAESEIMKAVLGTEKLRIVFVRMDLPGYVLPQLLNKTTFKSFRNFFLIDPEDTRTAERVIDAWKRNLQHERVARVEVNDRGDFFILSCALERYRVNLYEVYKAFKDVPVERLKKFDCSSTGFHWPDLDIDISFENIRYLCDPAYRAKKNAEKLKHNRQLGEAVRAVRKEHNLTQDAVEGVSERTIRAIERGDAHPNVSTLERLAAAHGLGFEEYFEELGKYL